VLDNTSIYPKARRVLNDYKRYVVSQSKRNLSMGRMVNGERKSYKASSKLYKSIKGYITGKMNRSISGKFTGGSAMPGLTFEMASYGKFIDEGVHGSKSSYLTNRDSKNKFSGGKKSVPLGPIRKWCKQKGISTKLAFVIGRSIYEKGIKASHFFTKPLDRRDKSFKKDYHKAVADDIATNFANKIEKKLLEKKNIKRTI